MCIIYSNLNSFTIYQFNKYNFIFFQAINSKSAESKYNKKLYINNGQFISSKQTKTAPIYHILRIIQCQTNCF